MTRVKDIALILLAVYVIFMKRQPGPEGKPGPQGPKGDTGPQGVPGGYGYGPPGQVWASGVGHGGSATYTLRPTKE